MTEMRILTVKQPFAWAILQGGKTVENRSRSTSYRGPVAIHAGLTWDYSGVFTVANLAPANVSRSRQRLLEVVGAIIGVVDLVGVHHWEDCRRGALGTCSLWAERQGYHWQLDDPRPLVEPIPYRGALGLRRLPADIIQQITDKTGGA